MIPWTIMALVAVVHFLIEPLLAQAAGRIPGDFLKTGPTYVFVALTCYVSAIVLYACFAASCEDWLWRHITWGPDRETVLGGVEYLGAYRVVPYFVTKWYGIIIYLAVAVLSSRYGHLAALRPRFAED